MRPDEARLLDMLIPMKKIKNNELNQIKFFCDQDKKRLSADSHKKYISNSQYIYNILCCGRKGTRTSDLTDVNRAL